MLILKKLSRKWLSFFERKWIKNLTGGEGDGAGNFSFWEWKKQSLYGIVYRKA